MSGIGNRGPFEDDFEPSFSPCDLVDRFLEEMHFPRFIYPEPGSIEELDPDFLISYDEPTKEEKLRQYITTTANLMASIDQGLENLVKPTFDFMPDSKRDYLALQVPCNIPGQTERLVTIEEAVNIYRNQLSDVKVSLLSMVRCISHIGIDELFEENLKEIGAAFLELRLSYLTTIKKAEEQWKSYSPFDVELMYLSATFDFVSDYVDMISKELEKKPDCNHERGYDV